MKGRVRILVKPIEDDIRAFEEKVEMVLEQIRERWIDATGKVTWLTLQDDLICIIEWCEAS